MCVPAMAFLVWAVPATRDPRIWLFCLIVALIGLFGIMAVDVGLFLIGGGKISESFQRAVFAVITSTDFPFVAIAIGSVINEWVTRRRKSAYPIA